MQSVLAKKPRSTSRSGKSSRQLGLPPLPSFGLPSPLLALLRRYYLKTLPVAILVLMSRSLSA